MALLDEITKGAKAIMGNQPGGAAATGAPTTVTHAVLDLLSGPGLGNLVQSMKDKGLSEIVSSWISTGPNLPVSPDQIQAALGSEKIAEVAKKAGISGEQAATQLSRVLPEVVDKLTPSGNLESGMLQQAINLLRSKLG